MNLVSQGNHYFAVEDESRNIGSRHIPPAFYKRLETAPLVLLEASDEERVDITLQEYVHDALAAFQQQTDEQTGFHAWAVYLQTSLDRIRKRLGGERHQRVSRMLQRAIEQHAKRGDTTGHRSWIAYLLHEYYDGMYSYQLEKKNSRIVFSGPGDAVLEYLRDRYQIESKQI